MRRLGLIAALVLLSASCSESPTKPNMDLVPQFDAAELAGPWVEVRDLGTLGGEYSHAQSINNVGQVVGESGYTADGGWHAFIWTEADGMTMLGTGHQSRAYDINDAGQVVGFARFRPILWTKADGATDLGSLGGGNGIAFGINESGHVVGYSVTASGRYHAFLWTEADGMKDLGTLGGPHSWARGINETGQVVGESVTESGEYHAFIWTEADGMKDLGTLNGTSSVARRINDSGQVIGDSGNPFLWTEADGMRDLGSFGGGGQGMDISNSGQVVGSSWTVDGVLHAFIWTEADGMINLGTPDERMSQAWGVNESGQIVGVRNIGGPYGHAVLWAIHPERTVERMAEELQTLAEDFASLGSLSDGQARAVAQLVGNALDHFAAGNLAAARGVLTGITSRVQGWMNGRNARLSEEDGQRIIGLVEEMLEALEG